MILTRKEALEKLKRDFEKEDPEKLVQRLMEFYKNMSDEMLKTVLEIEWDSFLIIASEPIHHA